MAEYQVCFTAIVVVVKVIMVTTMREESGDAFHCLHPFMHACKLRAAEKLLQVA